MTKQEATARRMIKAATTKNLIFQFELTEKINNENIPTVRGWLMDELEKRNPISFENWMDSDEDSPRRFYM